MDVIGILDGAGGVESHHGNASHQLVELFKKWPAEVKILAVVAGVPFFADPAVAAVVGLFRVRWVLCKNAFFGRAPRATLRLGFAHVASAWVEVAFVAKD